MSSGAVAQSSSDDSGVCYILLVIWMTSCVHIINTTIKTTSVCDGDARSLGGGSGWLAADTDGLAGDG